MEANFSVKGEEEEHQKLKLINETPIPTWQTTKGLTVIMVLGEEYSAATPQLL